MQTDISVAIHEHEQDNNNITPKVTFRHAEFDVGLPNEWGVLTVEIRHPNASKIEYKYFLHGNDWQSKAAVIRMAFRNPVTMP